MLPAPDAFGGTARFHLLQLLGQGGMGVVYEAYNRERSSRVALKTIRTLTPDNLLRFKNEFRTLQDLHHPNLVRLDELFEAGGTWFFTMELVEGTNLLRYVRTDVDVEAAPATATGIAGSERTPTGSTVPVESEPTVVLGSTPVPIGEQPTAPTAPTAPAFDEARLRRALPQLVRGLAALHAAGKVHRDVKPANIRVAPDDRVVLLDFGLVTDAYPRQLEGRAVGTVTYMAPEQLADQVIGPAADWYSVGVTLYLALTGRPPFLGSADEIASLKRLVEAPPASSVVPGIPADLDALCAALLARDPALRPDAVEILERLGGAPAAAPSMAPRPTGRLLVGRARELVVLRDAFSDVVRGATVTALVHGESGVGKSALVRHFLDSVGGPSTVVLAGRCYERESVPYKALNQVIDALSRHLAALPAAEAEALLPDRIDQVAEVFPALGKVAAIDARRRPDARTADPFQTRRVVFAALRELWARLGRRGPLVIGIDDLQWADLDSLALLAHLVEPAAAPMLVCATVRTAAEGTAHSPASLRAWLGADIRDVHVGRLAPDAARALVEALLATTPGRAGARADAIAAEAGGHPMFIEALVRDRRSPGTAPAPARLDDVLVARAAALDPAAAPVLDLVCLAGGPISQDVCRHAAGLSLDEIARLLSELRIAHLVKTHGPRRGDTVEPYHDRVREAILARLPDDARRDPHLRLARALEASGTADAEMLAAHFAAAGETARAARYAERAADRARVALAFAQAARLYRMALAQGARDAPRVKLALAEALENAGHGLEAAEEYLAVAETAGATQRLELRRRAAEQLLISGRIDEGLGVLRSVLDLVGLTLPATPRRAWWSLLSGRARVRLRGGAAAAQVRDAAQVPAEVLVRMDTCWSAAMGLAIVDPIRGADFQTRHLLLALDAGEPYRLACAVGAEAGFLAARGGPTRARTERLLARAASLAEQVGHPTAIGIATFAAGTADYLTGRWQTGLALCDRAAAVFRDRCTGVAWWSDTIQYFGLECLAYAGELAELARRAPAVLADAQARGDLYAATNARTGVPNLAWLITDDVDGARRQVAEAMAGWSHQAFHIQHLSELLALVQADLYAGDGDAAYRRITAAWPAITRAAIFHVQLTRIATYHQRARAALAAAAARPPGERRALLDDARRAARRIASERMPWSDPLAALADAAVHVLAGTPERAAASLDVAIRGFDAAGMAAYAAAARVRLGALRGGDEGAALMAAANADLAARAVRRPDRLVAMLAPGFSF